jgi:hypothetical protein
VVVDASGARTTVPLTVDTEPPPLPPMAGNSATAVPTKPALWPPLLYDAPEVVHAEGDASRVEVVAEGNSDTSQFTFVPPAGQQLAVGEYPNAERFPFEDPSHPGLTVSVGGAGCNEVAGRFTVKDIQLASSGAVERFWALWEQRCDNGPPSFGEVRVGEPETEAPEAVAPMAVRWPATAVGSTASQVPVTVGARAGGANIASVGLGGSDAGEFAIVGDSCEGVTLAAQQRCVIEVVAKPHTGGPRAAELLIGDVSGATTAVPLAVVAQP